MNLIGLPQQPVPAVGTVTGIATLHADAGQVTSAALTTAAAATFTLRLNNNQIEPNSIVLPVVFNGTNTQGNAVITKITPGMGSVDIQVTNQGAAAFNGTLSFVFAVLN